MKRKKEAAMLAHYLTLGLEESATDEQIRNRYLERIKIHTPETDAQRFQDITQAYEAIKNRRARIYSRIFTGRNTSDMEAALLYLVRAGRPKPKLVGLQELLRAPKPA
ncbi:MAG TPA: J domain-containing protein [Deltaproteobacteria bacterium]|nr:J domain-containing protein [Deltaproteobacteria bacterium]